MSVADADMVIEFRFGDSTYKLKRPDYKTEGRFVTLIRNRAIAACEYVSNANTRAEALGKVMGDISSGVYDYEYDPGSALPNYVQQSFQTPFGTKEWSRCVLMQENPVFRSSDSEKIFAKIWSDPDKRSELIQKINALNAPTPPIAPDSADQEPGQEPTAS